MNDGKNKGYHSNISSGKLRDFAERSKSRCSRAGQSLHPIVIQKSRGPVCESWWGRAWCENLDRYADFANRLPRGKQYLRAQAVINLTVEPNHVMALVQGGRRYPYDVDIEFDPLPASISEELAAHCARHIDSVEQLLQGEFPDDLRAVLLRPGGLFPSPDQIHFDCSCPDWAVLCKHVAAALYGIGVIFDIDPMAFFTLRDLEIDDFVHRAVSDRVEKMLSHAKAKSARIIPARDIKSLFGNL